MRTPRDVLLARHAARRPDLDRLREHVIASEVGSGESGSRQSLIAAAWHELFVSCRWAWRGIAAAWAVAICFQFMALNEPDPSTVNIQLSPEMRLAAEAQRRMRAELLGLVADADAVAEPSKPRSRIQSPAPSANAAIHFRRMA